MNPTTPTTPTTPTIIAYTHDERAIIGYDRHGSAILAADECLEHGGRTACRGPVQLHMTQRGNFKAFPRCEGHQDARMERERQTERDYHPDSPCAPSWFDPADAGESWDDDR